MTAPELRRAETAATQLRRLLHLIPQLADGEEHPVVEVARSAGIPPSALIADLNVLVHRYDTPAAWVDGVTIYLDGDHVSVNTVHFNRPMRLTMAELCALELGLMIAERERPAEERAPFATALERLRAAITKLPSNARQTELRAAHIPEAQAGILSAIRLAIREQRKIHLRYRSGSAEEAAERTVCPYATVFASGAWYAVAHCERSAALRFFRLDRIEAAEPLAERFTRPDLSAVEDVLADGRAFAAPEARTMTVRYSPRIARWIAERERKPLAEDRSLTLEHPVADDEWAVRHVLQYGPDAEVLAPPALRTLLAERLREMVAAG